MAINNEIKWLEQRFALMRIHLQEAKELFREQRKATQTLKQQRQQLAATEDKATKIKLVTKQACQLAELSIEFTQKHSLLLTRQRQEELALQDRIDRERRL